MVSLIINLYIFFTVEEQWKFWSEGLVEETSIHMFILYAHSVTSLHNVVFSGVNR